MSINSAMIMPENGATPAADKNSKTVAPGKGKQEESHGKTADTQEEAAFGSVFESMLGRFAHESKIKGTSLRFRKIEIGSPDIALKGKAGQKGKAAAGPLSAESKGSGLKVKVPVKTDSGALEAASVHVKTRSARQGQRVSAGSPLSAEASVQKGVKADKATAAVQGKPVLAINTKGGVTGKKTVLEKTIGTEKAAVQKAASSKVSTPQEAGSKMAATDTVLKLNLDTGSMRKMGLAPGGRKGKKLSGKEKTTLNPSTPVVEAVVSKTVKNKSSARVVEGAGAEVKIQAKAEKHPKAAEPKPTLGTSRKTAMDIQRESMAPGTAKAASPADTFKGMMEAMPVKGGPSVSRPSAEGTVSKVEMAPVVLRDAVVEQVRPAVVRMIRQGDSKVTLALSPERLGDLRVEVESTRGLVEVRFMVETTEAKTLIDASLSDLKSALNREGIESGSFQVDVHQDSASKQGQNGHSGRNGGRAAQSDYPGQEAHDEDHGARKKQSRSFGYNSMELEA